MKWSTIRNSLLFAAVSLPMIASACSVSSVPDGIELLTKADAVVRVKVLAYQTPPTDLNQWTTGVPASLVSFQVMETIHGNAPQTFALHGYITQQNDFNDRPSPYTFVRPGGRAGSCFANSYKQGAEYLLFLKKDASGDLTVNWAALAPVNEQLHGQDDPWLIWVRKQAGEMRR